MQLTIDNLDGRGTLDYSAGLSTTKALVIDRKLNVPTICTFRLSACGNNLAWPVRDGRVVVSGDSGLLLFTGYIAFDPALEFAGNRADGAVYEAEIFATSDEILLDRQPVPQTGKTTGQTIADALRALTGRVGKMSLSIDPSLAQASASDFLIRPDHSWSGNAGALATAACASYRAIGGTVTVAPIGSVVHSLQEEDGTLQMEGLAAATAKAPVNDVTVCGETEPTAYVTEIFRGDGVTSAFQLTRVPMFPSTGQAKPLIDLFPGPVVNSVLWSLIDSTASISIAANGLAFKGGTGMDGQTFLASIDQFELGGQLVAETAGVQIQPGGAGVLCGLYAAGWTSEQCFAGFRVTAGQGSSQVTPMVGGNDTGAPVPIQAGHSYTFKTRVYCKEIQRVLQTYGYLQDTQIVSVGGDQLSSPVNITLEMQDVTGGANGIVTVLYEGAVAYSPASCYFLPFSSITLTGSVQSASVRQLGLAHVSSQAAGSGAVTRRMGSAMEGGECQVEHSGRLQFYPGCLPKAGELVTVTYRIPGRSIARISNLQSVEAESHGPISGTLCWSGSLVSPVPRSSEDCENAATALLAIAGDRNSAWRGTYAACNLQTDVWPGDLLQVTASGPWLQASLIVREVRLELATSAPTLAKYTIQFANDWAEGLAMKLSSTIPNDAWVPQLPTAAGGVLTNLDGLLVSSADSNSIQVMAGVTPPVNGGFEVRRSDWSFRAGNDPDLVLRSPVANFSIPREGGAERYYIRLFDGSMPPLYSRFSSVIFNNVPL